MDPVNVRLDGETASELRRRAEASGTSLNAYSSELLRQTLITGPFARPVSVPVGFGLAAEAWERRVSEPGGKFNWIVLFEGVDGRAVFVISGHIEHFSPMFVRMHVMPGENAIAIPRAKLMGWEKLDRFDESAVMEHLKLLEPHQAFLHPLVAIPRRVLAANGLRWWSQS